MTQFEDTASLIEKADTYYDLFGDPDDGVTLEAYVKREYRRLVRLIHPDYFDGTSMHDRAVRALKKLNEHYERADAAVKSDTYGNVELITWRVGRSVHRVLHRALPGELCSIYIARSVTKALPTERDSFCKVAGSSQDNELLHAEAKALKRLHRDTPEELRVFYPELLDSFEYGSAGNRRVNVLGYLDGFYTLAQVKQAFPTGISGIHMAWIWRRVLWALGHVHDAGIVHGAILPEHIMILPEKHGLLLVDWCYASLADDNGAYPAIKAIVPNYRSWYPPEVFAKEPPRAATDITMAARCMIELTGGDPETGQYSLHAELPRQFQAFLRGCLGPHHSARPDSALELLSEFDAVMRDMGEPYFPRKFRPFVMPSGMATV